MNGLMTAFSTVLHLLVMPYRQVMPPSVLRHLSMMTVLCIQNENIKHVYKVLRTVHGNKQLITVMVNETVCFY